MPRLVYRAIYLSTDASRRAMTTYSIRGCHTGYYHNVLALRLIAGTYMNAQKSYTNTVQCDIKFNQSWMGVTQILRNPNSMTFVRRVVSDMLPKG